MLYLIEWTVKPENRIACGNIFGNMTAEDDVKDVGDEIKLVGRWHTLGGTGGTCIVDCSDHGALNTFMLNWGPLCDISVHPVVDDASSRASVQSKPYFVKKE